MREAISWRIRGLVMARSYLRDDDQFLCNWCCGRLNANQVVIDHILAVALGGTNDPDNLTVSCHRCNDMKRAQPADDAERRINAFLENGRRR